MSERQAVAALSRLERQFIADHPANPLGKGMPGGSSLRLDGESHRGAWRALVRRDPCAYCGATGGSIDHIVARNPLVAVPFGGKFSWLNEIGACSRCNSSKGSDSLLLFLAVRAGCEGVRAARRGVRATGNTVPRSV